MSPRPDRSERSIAAARLAGSSLPPAAFLSRLIAGVALIGLFVAALAALAVLQSHHQYQERAEVTAQNLAQALEHDLAGAIKADEMALFAVGDEYRRQRDTGRVDGRTLNAQIEKIRARLPEIEALRVADASGIAVFGTGVDPAAHIDISDRQHFIRLRDVPGTGLAISRPQVSRVNHRSVIVLAHRLERPDGSFDGIAFATIALESLAGKLAAIEVGAHGAITMRSTDLDLIVRHPQPADIVSGQRVVSTELERMVQSQPLAGVYVANVRMDNTPRTNAYRKIADYPLYILIGLADEDYLTEWRKQAKATAALAGFCILITVFAARVIYLAWKHQQAATAFAETLIDSLPGVFYRLDRKLRLVAWNKTVEAQLGTDGLVSAQDSILNIIHPDDREEFGASIEKAFEQKHTEVEARLRLLNGVTRYFHFIGIPMLMDGRIYLLGTGVDITAHRKVEKALLEKTDELQRSNAELEQFAYSVSHDMRQPLRMVSGHLQLLERSLKGTLDDENRENMAFALDGAKRMDAMIVSLLEYSRVGRMTKAKEWGPSRVPLDEALRFLAPAVEEAHADINVCGEWPQIFASHDEMTRLFQNLIGNAVKYREAGHAPHIAVTSTVMADSWQVSIRDDGIGIDPKQIERLFQFFSRLQPRTRFDGTGMGLALCRKIIEHHSGRIWVESSGEGQGCNFFFELPLIAADAAATDAGPKLGDHHAE